MACCVFLSLWQRRAFRLSSCRSTATRRYLYDSTSIFEDWNQLSNRYGPRYKSSLIRKRNEVIKIKENEQTKTSRLSILKLRNKSRHNRRRIKLLRTYEICGVKTTLEEEDLGRSTGYVERGRGVYRCYGDPRTCSDMYAVNSASLSVNTGSSPNYVIVCTCSLMKSRNHSDQIQ